ncbi:MAG TPA: cytochrome c3 family protein [Anaerolineales bacterium]
MIKKLFEWVISPMGRIAVLIAVVSMVSLTAFGIYQSQQSLKPQPIQFPHSTHVNLQIQCLYCHPGPLRGPSSGLPTLEKCWGCHQQIAKTDTSELLRPMREAIANGTNFVWVPVAQVPDFVHYNHRPHIAAGLNCEDCHGDVRQMGIYENPQVLNMGWCLKCHKETAGDDQEKLNKLTDCGTCHY